jgi:predicted transcriptional regulator
MTDRHKHLLTLSAQIVTAQVRHNEVASERLPNLILNIYNTLLEVGRLPDVQFSDTIHASEGAFNGHTAHDVNRTSHSHNVYEHPRYGQTVFPDYLICMEDGLSMTMLKRHLLAVHGMTPADYREKWGLPDEYPMVAANYAKLRSSLALERGLGLKPEERGAKQRKRRTTNAAR